MSRYDDDPNNPPGIHDPDWARFGISNPNQLQSPTGDPIRWSGTMVTALDQVPLAPPPFADLFTITTPQIIQVQPRDAYPRNWSIVGKLSWLSAIWQAAADYPPPASFSCNAFLQIITGMGQVQLVQTILLAAGGVGIPRYPGSPLLGLCNQQLAASGTEAPAGPYDQDLSYPGGAATQTWGRSFAAIGAIVGNSISVRALYRPGVNFAGTYPGATAKLDLMLTPYAAGEGL